MFLRSGIIQQMHLFLSWHQKLTSALLQGTLLKKIGRKVPVLFKATYKKDVYVTIWSGLFVSSLPWVFFNISFKKLLS